LTNNTSVPVLVTWDIDPDSWIPGEKRRWALDTAMARLLDEPALRAKLRRNGQQTVIEEFNVERNVRRFAAALWPNWFEV